MKKFLLVLIAAALIGCSSSDTVSNDDLKIRKADEFIDTGSSSVKLLFKTNEGADVVVYLGESSDKLEAVKEIKGYSYNNELEINGLTPNKSYYYKIVSTKDGKEVESELKELKKADRKNSTDKAEWARTAVFYEMFVRSFYDTNGDGIGDFKGIEQKMDYLKELGVDGMWIMPMMDSPSYHGYDVQNYYAVEPDYGTMEDFESMVKAAHERGIKITIDLVLNHSSSQNKMFTDFLSGKGSADFYTTADEFDNTDESGPWGQNIWYSKSGKTYLATFQSEMPDLNYRSQNVREEAKNIAKFWLEKGVDGFRLDATLHLDDKKPEVTHNWWKEFNEYVKSINPDAFIVGECWLESNEEIAPFFADMDSSFNFKLNMDVINFLNGKDIDLAGNIETGDKIYRGYADNYIDTTFLSNHDTDRIAYAVKGDKNKTRMAAVLSMTLPGSPYIYYGEEIGQKGAGDTPARAPFEWYASNSGSGLTTWIQNGLNRANDGISVEEQINGDSLLNYYKKLIKLRKENKELFTTIPKKLNTPEGIYGYESKGNGYKIYVMLNRSNSNKSINMSEITGNSCSEMLEGRTGENGVYTIKAGENLIFKE